MDYLDWDSLGKHFYLLDTFKGIDERFTSAQDKAAGVVEKNPLPTSRAVFTPTKSTMSEQIFPSGRILLLLKGQFRKRYRRFAPTK
jgi:hypothetical protein